MQPGREISGEIARVLRPFFPLSPPSDGSRGVTFETEDFKVTAACASGYIGVSHLLMHEYFMYLQLNEGNCKLIETGVLCISS